MKTIITILTLSVSPLFIYAQQMDSRPFAERKADYEKLVEYRSGFSDANTRAAADTLLLNDRWAIINYSPLCDFTEITPTLVQDNAPFAQAMTSPKPPYCFWEAISFKQAYYPAHNCRRGFIATWVIRDHKLYLKTIRLWTPDQMWQSYLMKARKKQAINPTREEVISRLEKATARTFTGDSLLFADWFTGTLTGRAKLFTSTESRQDKNVQIQLKNGVVEKIEIKQPDPIAKTISSTIDYFFDEPQQAFNNWHTTPIE